MTQTIRAQAVLALVAALEALPGVTVELMPGGPPARWPALHIDDEGGDTVRETGSETRMTVDLGLMGFVQGVGGRAVWEAVDALWGAAIAAIKADEQFGGLVTQVSLGALAIDEIDAADVRQTGFRQQLSLEIGFLTADPTQAGG